MSPDKIDTEPLVNDLEEFTVPAGATALPIVATSCGGDGSFPVVAEREFLVSDSPEAVEADLRSQANGLGWVNPSGLLVMGELKRGDRTLGVFVRSHFGAPPSVVVHVASTALC